MAAPAIAQSADPPSDTQTMFPHAADSRWSLGGQLNVIGQAHGDFRSPYEGAHSFRSASEDAISVVWTIDTRLKLRKGFDIQFDVESAGGHGLSDAAGLAGFTNLDVVRNPELGAAPYMARLVVHWTHAGVRSDRAVHVRVGRMSIVDFFDVNAVGSDSHLQFTNWTIDNTGAFDYAADTRGYTYAAVGEYATPRWSIRGSEALMPKVANGIELEWNVTRARGEMLELEFRPQRSVVVRALGYVNHARMGSYQEAIEAFAAGADPAPDIEAHRRQGRTKAGIAADAEYTVTHGMRLFIRSGWNDGHNESFAYTEVDRTIVAGGDVSGAAWHRAGDRFGIALVSNALSGPHREYLRLGGLGFLLGDGTLQYGRERIAESYYTAHLWRGLFVAADLQAIHNPGYNHDRGPALVPGLRVHVDF